MGLSTQIKKGGIGKEGKEMGQTNITSKGESGAKDRTRAIVACSDPEIWQILLSVLSQFELQPVLSETLDDAKGLIT